jgi:hypothetical protein
MEKYQGHNSGYFTAKTRLFSGLNIHGRTTSILSFAKSVYPKE